MEMTGLLKDDADDAGKKTELSGMGMGELGGEAVEDRVVGVDHGGSGRGEGGLMGVGGRGGGVKTRR